MYPSPHAIITSSMLEDYIKRVIFDGKILASNMVDLRGGFWSLSWIMGSGVCWIFDVVIWTLF